MANISVSPVLNRAQPQQCTLLSTFLSKRARGINGILSRFGLNTGIDLTIFA